MEAPISSPDCIAVINAGSSSVKFALYAATGEVDLLFRGQVESLGVAPHLRIDDAQGNAVADQTWPAEGFNHGAATRAILTTGRELIGDARVVGIGHRVVHGGAGYSAPARLDDHILAALSELIPLAPLHQPHNLAPIRAIMEAAAHIPQVACFDTAFHRSQDHLAQSFALPRWLSDEGVRRYGFHGLSYQYLLSRLAVFDTRMATARVIMAHLGNGASLCAAHHGRSVASTMGFTAVDGLMMGTRCGALDPGVVVYLMQHHHMDATAIEDLIYRKSGLLGVSGISSDMRALRASSDPKAREAIALFVYRIVREVGSLVAALGGLDVIVFAGGIGENDARTREEVIAGCRWMDAELDPERNARGAGLISTDASRVALWVIRTDEEQLIARQTLQVLTERAD
jgi:acetate kinase